MQAIRNRIPLLCLPVVISCTSQAMNDTIRAPSTSTRQAQQSLDESAGPDDGILSAFGDRRCGCLGAEFGKLSCEDFELNGSRLGAFVYNKAAPRSYIVAAPHGGYDLNTDRVVANLFGTVTSDTSQDDQWGKVIAHGFRGLCKKGFQANVNRPSLLAQDGCRQDSSDPNLALASKIYARYEALLDSFGPHADQRLYVEIHGQNTPGLENTIEIATARVTSSEAQRIKEIFEQEIQALKLSNGQTLNIAIQPLEHVHWNAIPTKVCGSMYHMAPTPSLHAECPGLIRERERTKDAVMYFSRVLARIATDVYPAKPGSSPSP